MDEPQHIDISAPISEMKSDAMKTSLLPNITRFKREALLKERVAITDNIQPVLDQKEFPCVHEAVSKIKVSDNETIEKNWYCVFTEIPESEDLVKEVWKYIQDTEAGRQNKTLRNRIYQQYVDSGKLHLRKIHPDEFINDDILEKVMSDIEKKSYTDSDILQCAQNQVTKLQSQIEIHEQAFTAITAVCGDSQDPSSAAILLKEWDDDAVQNAVEAVCDMVERLNKMSSDQTKAKKLAEELETNKQKLEQAHKSLESEKIAHMKTTQQLEREQTMRKNDVDQLIKKHENQVQSMLNANREDLEKLIDGKNNEHKTQIESLLHKNEKTMCEMQTNFKTQLESEQNKHQKAIKDIHKQYKNDSLKRDIAVQEKDQQLVKSITRVHASIKSDIKAHEKKQKDAIERLHTRVIEMKPLAPTTFQLNIPSAGPPNVYSGTSRSTTKQ